MNTEGLEVIALPPGTGKIAQNLDSWHDGEPLEFRVTGHTGLLRVGLHATPTGNETNPETGLVFDPVDLELGVFSIPKAELAGVAERDKVYYSLWEGVAGKAIIRAVGVISKKPSITVPDFEFPPQVILTDLTIFPTPSVVSEIASVGTIVGVIEGWADGSTLALTDDSGGMFELRGANITIGVSGLTYDAAQPYSVTVQETHPDVVEPRETTFPITVTQYVETDLVLTITDTNGVAMTETDTATPFRLSLTGIIPQPFYGLPASLLIDGVDSGLSVSAAAIRAGSDVDPSGLSPGQLIARITDGTTTLDSQAVTLEAAEVAPVAVESEPVFLELGSTVQRIPLSTLFSGDVQTYELSGLTRGFSIDGTDLVISPTTDPKTGTGRMDEQALPVAATNAHGTTHAKRTISVGTYSVAPVLLNNLADRVYDQNTGIWTYSILPSLDPAGGTVETWSLTAAPTGVTIGQNGTLFVDTDSTGALDGASITIVATNASGSSNPLTIPLTVYEPTLRIVADRASALPGEIPNFRIIGLTEEEKIYSLITWDLDDTTLPAFLNAAHPKYGALGVRKDGWMTAHAWRTSGVKAITATVYRSFSGGPETVTIDFTVEEPAFTKTYAVPVTPGGTIPAGATEVASVQEALGLINPNDSGHIYVERGVDERFTATEDVIRNGRVLLQAYGSTASPRPILRPAAGLELFNNVRDVANGDFGKFVCIGVDLQGDDSAATGTTNSENSMRHGCGMEVHFSGGLISGFRSGLVEFQFNTNSRSAFFDAKITDWCNFGAYVQQGSLYSAFCVISQNPLAVNGLEEKAPTLALNWPDHGPARVSTLVETYSYGDELFSANGWSKSNPAFRVAHQPIYRLGSTAGNGGNGLVIGIWAEGGEGINFLSIPGEGALSRYDRMIVKGCDIVATANSNALFGIGHSNTAIVGNRIVVPRVHRELLNAFGFVKYERGSHIYPNWYGGYLICRHNTMVYLVDQANIDYFSYMETLPSGEQVLRTVSKPTFAGLLNASPLANDLATDFSDNILYAPNITLTGDAAPRTDTPVSDAAVGIAGKYLGLRMDTTGDGVMDTEDTAYASPTNIGVDARPISPPALSSGIVPAGDFDGTPRANAYVGAWGQVAP